MLPTFPVHIEFEPADNPGTAPLWAIPAGRILMLLWRPTHLCSASWFGEAMIAAKLIQSRRPKSIEQLEACFEPVIERAGDFSDFTSVDVKIFCKEAIEYFTGQDAVPYTGEVAGLASMK